MRASDAEVRACAGQRRLAFLNGGQFRASLTKSLDNGSYIRVSLKSLKDNTPTYLPVPVVANGSKIATIPGIDPRNAFFIGSKFGADTTVDKNGNRVTSNPADGLSVDVTSIGVERPSRRCTCR